MSWRSEPRFIRIDCFKKGMVLLDLSTCVKFVNQILPLVLNVGIFKNRLFKPSIVLFSYKNNENFSNLS